MPARYIKEQREEAKRQQMLLRMQPKFNTAKPLEKYFHKAIEIIFSGKMDEATRSGSGLHPNIREIERFYSSISKFPEEVNKCKHAFLHLADKKAFKLLEDPKMIQGLIRAMSMSIFWVRDFENWEKTSHNINKQFSSILRHMFAKYPVPSFLDNAWFEPRYNIQSKECIDWFLHLGIGKSARELTNFPVPMTKKMAHAFVTTPDGYDINDAIRRAQVLSMGGNESLAWYVAASRIGHGQYSNEEFWLSVIQFLCKAPMFDYSRVPGMLDYIYDQKYSANLMRDASGIVRRTIANPGFSMKGRTLEALLRNTEEWHLRMSKEKRHIKNDIAWDGTGIPMFEHKDGSEDNGTAKWYSIIELLKTSDLQEEGRAMRHCVYSYAESCRKGRCSIWSLRMQTQFSNKEERVATIEVINQSKMIVQVRAKNNARAEAKGKALIEKWAKGAGLGISGSAFGGW